MRLLAKECRNNKKAGVAQLAEHPTCNRTVEGSIPFASIRNCRSYFRKGIGQVLDSVLHRLLPLFHLFAERLTF